MNGIIFHFSENNSNLSNVNARRCMITELSTPIIEKTTHFSMERKKIARFLFPKGHINAINLVLPPRYLTQESCNYFDSFHESICR